MYVTRPYSAILGGLGRFGPLYRRIYFPIDDEGLYDEPIVHAVGEIARVPDPITFQYRMDNRIIGF